MIDNVYRWFIDWHSWHHYDGAQPFVTLFCLPLRHLTQWTIARHPDYDMDVTTTSSMFYSVKATDNPEIICLSSDIWKPDTQTVSRSIKPQRCWQIEVTLNYDWSAEVITHWALAKMLLQCVAVSMLWFSDLEPAPSPPQTPVKWACGSNSRLVGWLVYIIRHKKWHWDYNAHHKG